MKYMPELLEILKILTPLVFGIILGYLGYRYQINHGRVNTKRERLLENIIKIEQILTDISDLEYTKYRIFEILQKSDRIGKRNQELLELISANSEKMGRLSIKADQDENVIMEMEKVANLSHESRTKLEENIKVLEKDIAELATVEGKVEDLTKKIFHLDIGTVSLIVDPSGELLSMLNELLSMLNSDSQSPYDQQIDLHIKIKNLLDKRINKT